RQIVVEPDHRQHGRNLDRIDVGAPRDDPSAAPGEPVVHQAAQPAVQDMPEVRLADAARLLAAQIHAPILYGTPRRDAGCPGSFNDPTRVSLLLSTLSTVRSRSR